MTTPNAAADFADFRVVPAAETALLTPEQAPVPNADQSVELFATGVHEAVFTIANGGATKEQVEEIVLSRQAHLRNGEEIALIERRGNDVIHQQFHSLVSVQALIADLRHRGIQATVQLNWAEVV